MVKITGKYKRTTSENYDEFLSKVGVSFLLRKAATASTPTMEISESNGKWKFLTSTTMKSIELNFELGVPFDEKTPDGREVTTTVTKESDTKMVTVQKAKKEGQHDVTVIRDFKDEGIEVSMICDDVVCKQFFERLQ